mmetsp:Transcript_76867/g.169788  ORF Transcript_76867/g.169788 Transcript_76867/m.169788 type:complete len:205 (-) Transcript_76867:185-799(-)
MNMSSIAWQDHDAPIPERRLHISFVPISQTHRTHRTIVSMTSIGSIGFLRVLPAKAGHLSPHDPFREFLRHPTVTGVTGLQPVDGQQHPQRHALLCQGQLRRRIPQPGAMEGIAVLAVPTTLHLWRLPWMVPGVLQEREPATYVRDEGIHHLRKLRRKRTLEILTRLLRHVEVQDQDGLQSMLQEALHGVHVILQTFAELANSL